MLLKCPLTATEKQVHLGQLHMRPIQWHLKNHWKVPESLEKVIPVPQVFTNPLNGVSKKQMSFKVSCYTHSAMLFCRYLRRRLGHSLRRSHGKRDLIPARNYLELKGAFLALKEFQDCFSNKIVLIAMDNTTVVAYINKEGGMRSGPLCTLLCRILTWCSRKLLTLKAWHISGQLNVVADKLSRLGEIIQIEWSLLSEVFQWICTRWHQSQIDLFPTIFNNKLPQFESSGPDSLAWAVDALSMLWEDLDLYILLAVAILCIVVVKLRNIPCRRIILIAPGWPNLTWFWDLVAMSS